MPELRRFLLWKLGRWRAAKSREKGVEVVAEAIASSLLIVGSQVGKVGPRGGLLGLGALVGSSPRSIGSVVGGLEARE